MLNKRLAWRLVVLALSAGSVWVVGCDSGSTGGGGGFDSGSQFVSSDDKVGTIDLSVRENPLNVAQTSPFSVFVRDQNGEAVPQIQISCDTERELALVEPTTGLEMTDSYGHMSGVVGCRAPGSFQIGCRLPVGANKRAFVSVKCVGDAPEGFTGWPQAGGGSLGGGVDTSDNDQGGGSLSVKSVSMADGGNTNTTSIDVLQRTCADGTAEPFTDTIATFTVVNNGNEPIVINSYRYVVAKYQGNASLESGELSVLSGSIAPDGGTGVFSVLFMNAANSNKRYYTADGGEVVTCPGMCGFKNVTFYLYGEKNSGESVEIVTSTSVSLGLFDNCADGGSSSSSSSTSSSASSASSAAAGVSGGIVTF